MDSNEFDTNDVGYYPDGLTPPMIDALIAEAFASADQAAAAPTSSLLDDAAVWRRARRIERQTVNAVVRTLPLRPVSTGPDGQEAA